jgi:hypothetical protein
MAAWSVAFRRTARCPRDGPASRRAIYDRFRGRNDERQKTTTTASVLPGHAGLGLMADDLAVVRFDDPRLAAMFERSPHREDRVMALEWVTGKRFQIRAEAAAKERPSSHQADLRQNSRDCEPPTTGVSKVRSIRGPPSSFGLLVPNTIGGGDLMGTDQATRETKQCRFCYEPMDVRATVCPHCRRQVFRATLRSEVRRAVLKILVLVFVGLTFSFWFDALVVVCGWAAGIMTQHMFDGLPLPAHSQPAHKDHRTRQLQLVHRGKPKAQ